MVYVSVQDVVFINNAICNAEILNFALLDSAVAQAQHYRFETPQEIAGAYLFFLCKNHPFVDGNKRTAFITCAYFLAANGLSFYATTEEIVNLMTDVAIGMVDLDYIEKWIKEHC